MLSIALDLRPRCCNWCRRSHFSESSAARRTARRSRGVLGSRGRCRIPRVTASLSTSRTSATYSPVDAPATIALVVSPAGRRTDGSPANGVCSGMAATCRRMTCTTLGICDSMSWRETPSLVSRRIRTWSFPSMFSTKREAPNSAHSGSHVSEVCRCMRSARDTNRLASCPAMATKSRPTVLTRKTGPLRRYSCTKNARGSRATASVLPMSGRPRASGRPPARRRSARAVGRTIRTSVATARPTRSSRLTVSIRRRAFFSSSGVSSLRQTSQASSRLMITMSAGSGISSLNRTRITRSLMCSCATPLAAGYRRACATSGLSDRNPSSPGSNRIPRAISLSIVRSRICRPRRAVCSTQYSAPRVVSLAAMAASVGSSTSSPTGVGSLSVSASRSVSTRLASCRSISTAPASTRSSVRSVSGRNVPVCSSRRKSRSSSAESSINHAPGRCPNVPRCRPRPAPCSRPAVARGAPQGSAPRRPRPAPRRRTSAARRPFRQTR